MAFPVEHKTTFVLDHSSYFAKSSKQSIEYDIGSKNRAANMIPAAPISKSMWTCNVEAMMEYMRVVFDIFPTDRLIKVVSGSQSLNNWSLKDQNLSKLMVPLGHLGPPSGKKSDEEYTLMNGLENAMACMCEMSEAQQAADRDLVQNKGRIICLTNIKSETQLKSTEEYVVELLNQNNGRAADSEDLLPIEQCELVILNVVPFGEESKITEKQLAQVSGQVSCVVYNSQSGRIVYNRLISLVQEHYHLSSTTVTGIPMRDELNSSSSANYDVEILHPKQVHKELLKSAAADGLIIPSTEGLLTETITLKWCTPKSNVVELHYCTEVHRITPVDVNSRPSSCLTNFLLSGRAVMLEQPKRTGSKVISHMLASHGGEIFIHTIHTGRSLLEDPPSICEGCGGRVTDYRIPDFGDFMKENRLAPAAPNMSLKPTENSFIDRAKLHLERMSRYWPMVIGETIIFNMASHFDPLLSLIVKEMLDEDEVMECTKAIYHVAGMESRNEALPVVSTGARSKGPKREEQYRQMWSELEALVKSYADTSPNHKRILDCIQNIYKSDTSKGGEKAVKEEKIDIDMEQTWKELERFQKMTEREKQDLIKPEPVPSQPKRQRTSLDEPFPRTVGGGQSLLSMWTNRIKSVHSRRHCEFAGRLNSDTNIAELYTHLKEENDKDVIQT